MPYAVEVNNARQVAGSTMDQSIYQENGFTDRQAYLDNLKEDYDPDIVDLLADLLGPSEDFDGLVTSLEDYCE